MMRNPAVIAAALVCLAGCGIESPTSQLPPGPFEPGTPTQSVSREPRRQPSERIELLDQIDTALAYWNVERPMTYELTVSLRCFCDAGVPFVSRVTGVTVTRSAGGHRSDGRSGRLSLRTVESLFSEARRAVSSDADAVEVEFDPRFRYPTRIRIDQWRDAIDDEKEWIARLHVRTANGATR